MEREYKIFFDAVLSDGELSTYVKAKSIRGAKSKFTKEWGKEYKINSVYQTKPFIPMRLTCIGFVGGVR